MKNHLVLGLVRSADLADDLVGPSAAATKLRSNVYQSEDRDWKDVKVRQQRPEWRAALRLSDQIRALLCHRDTGNKGSCNMYITNGFGFDFHLFFYF